MKTLNGVGVLGEIEITPLRRRFNSTDSDTPFAAIEVEVDQCRTFGSCEYSTMLLFNEIERG